MTSCESMWRNLGLRKRLSWLFVLLCRGTVLHGLFCVLAMLHRCGGWCSSLLQLCVCVFNFNLFLLRRKGTKYQLLGYALSMYVIVRTRASKTTEMDPPPSSLIESALLQLSYELKGPPYISLCSKGPCRLQWEFLVAKAAVMVWVCLHWWWRMLDVRQFQVWTAHHFLLLRPAGSAWYVRVLSFLLKNTLVRSFFGGLITITARFNAGCPSLWQEEEHHRVPCSLPCHWFFAGKHISLLYTSCSMGCRFRAYTSG